MFIDVGNVFNNFDDYEICCSVGFGVCWCLLLGLICVDFVCGVEEGWEWWLYLSMGLDL